MSNEELNKLDIWKNKKCTRCGRSYPNTILNIEGYIHHNIDFVCLDNKSCKRYQRRKMKNDFEQAINEMNKYYMNKYVEKYRSVQPQKKRTLESKIFSEHLRVSKGISKDEWYNTSSKGE